MISLNVPKNITLKVSQKEFEQFAIANRDLRLERTHDGEMIVMPPTGGETGRNNSALVARLWNWNDTQGKGIVFDSSTGFKLPNGAIKSPDVSWVSNEKWKALTSEQKKKFPPICPEFVIELRSETDNLKTLQNKMLEYLDNGLLLGWLIDPISKQVEIYRQGQEREILDEPDRLSGENLLSGFNLDLTSIW